MEFVCARLGKNLDTAIAEFVVLRRERILVDADFANRRLRRKLPSGKTVDVNLASIGPRRGSRQRLQFRLQFVRIIGESLKILTLNNDGAGIALRRHLDTWRLFLNRYVLLLHFDFERYVQPLRLSGSNRDILPPKHREAFRCRAHVVAAGSNPL